MLTTVTTIVMSLHVLKSHMLMQASDHLSIVNQKVAMALHLQEAQMVLDIKSIFSKPELHHSLLQAIDGSITDAERFILHKELARDTFSRHYTDFYLIGKDRHIISSLNRKYVGMLVPEIARKAIVRLDAGEQYVLTHTFMFRGKITMWALVPVVDAGNQGVGYFALRLGVQHRFSATTLSTGIASHSMETYLVNMQGMMLSESRFESQLEKLGWLEKGAMTTLNLRISDPGENLLETSNHLPQSYAWPLTWAMQQVLKGEMSAGEIYRDYRGKPVLGVWQWDKTLHAAIITEIDEDEALDDYLFARNIIVLLLIIIVVGSFITSQAYSHLRIASEKEANKNRNLLLESTAEAIYGIDMQGRCTFVNQTFLNIMAYEESEVLGKNMHDLIHYAHADGKSQPVEMCNIYQAHHAHTKAHADDDVFWRKDGKSLQVEYWSHPIFDGDECTGSVITFLDISEKLNALKAREEMEKQVQHTQRLESLGVLAGGIAHDFNNLLAAILGNASLASSKMLKKPLEAKERVEKIIQSAEKAGVLCRQMLAYSGKGQFVLKPIDMAAAVEEMTHLLEVSIDKSVVIKYHMNKGLPVVMVDEAQIQQVLMNLVTNANDAIGGRSGVISITAGMMHADADYLASCYGENPESGRYVYIEVSDTGCGMDKETIEKVFDPFFTTKLTGRGLGMSAVLGIVRGHHGALKVYSELGRGTTFKFLLPVDESQSLQAAEKVEGVQGEFSGGTVLVVDDEETVLEVSCAIFEEMGFQTLSAKHGLEALELYKQHQDDITLVLTDLTMPHMGGKELFTELRKLNPDCSVILSSGYSSEDAIQQFAGKGLAGFVQKPFTPTVLAQEIRKILGEKA